MRRAYLVVPLLVAIVAGACSETTAEPTPVAITVPPVPAASPTQAALVPSPSPTARPPSPTAIPPIAAPEPVTTSGPGVPTPEERARMGGELTIVSREAIAHQDVQQEVSPALTTWGPGMAYSRLLRFKSGLDVVLPSLEVECELCESWSMPDPTTFVFTLRDDVRWQDVAPLDGRRLVADDLVFSYERQRTPGWPNSPLLEIVDGVEATEDFELRITLSAPDADFPGALADGHSKIVAREVVELNGDLKDGPTIGSGPWILVRSRPDASHIFRRNPDYFERDLPFLDGLNVSIIPDEDTREAAFRTRLVDVRQMEPSEWEAYKADEPNAPLLEHPDAGTGFEVAFNASAPPFDDVRVRRAALLAMDPWSAIEVIWLGKAFVSLGLVPSQADWLLPRSELEPFFAKPEEARELLVDAATEIPAPVFIPVSVRIRVGDFGEAYVSHAERIADEMRAVGFAPEVEVVNRRRFGVDVWLGGDYQMLAGPIAPIAAPNGYLLPVLHSRGAWNTAGVRDSGLDSLIERQAGEYESEVRAELVQLIQRRVFENAHRFMPATRIAIWTWLPRVRNFHPNFSGSEYAHWSGVWVER